MKLRATFSVFDVEARRKPVPGGTVKVVSNSKGLRRRLEQPVVAQAVAPTVTRVWLQDGSQWIFRPAEQEKQTLTALVLGSPKDNAAAERAFYLTSKHLRLDVVPKTVRVDWNGTAGTLQRCVETEPGVRQGHVDRDSLIATLILHEVTNTYDPVRRNLTWEETRPGVFRCLAIDGGATFGFSRPDARSAAALPLKLGHFEDVEVPLRMLARLRSVDVEHWRADLLREGLTVGQVDRAERALRKIVETGRVRG